MTDSERRAISDKLIARTVELKTLIKNRKISKLEYEVAKARHAVAMKK